MSTQLNVERARWKGGAKALKVPQYLVGFYSGVGGARWMAMILNLIALNINKAGLQRRHPLSLLCDQTMAHNDPPPPPNHEQNVPPLSTSHV